LRLSGFAREQKSCYSGDKQIPGHELSGEEIKITAEMLYATEVTEDTGLKIYSKEFSLCSLRPLWQDSCRRGRLPCFFF
jgi:hypothetical protein